MPEVKLTKRPDGTFVMYLIEQGPWTSEPIDHLRSIQDRLYDYFDVAVDGHLAKLYPDSVGRAVVTSLVFECKEMTLAELTNKPYLDSSRKLILGFDGSGR